MNKFFKKLKNISWIILIIGAIGTFFYNLIGFAILDTTKGIFGVMGFIIGVVTGIVTVFIILMTLITFKENIKRNIVLILIALGALFKYGGYILDIPYYIFEGPKVYEGYCSVQSKERIDKSGPSNTPPLRYRAYTLYLDNDEQLKCPRHTKLQGEGVYSITYMPFSKHILWLKKLDNSYLDGIKEHLDTFSKPINETYITSINRKGETYYYKSKCTIKIKSMVPKEKSEAFMTTVNFNTSLTEDINRWIEKFSKEEPKGEYVAFKIIFEYSDFETNDPHPPMSKMIWGADHIERWSDAFSFGMNLMDFYTGGLRRELIEKDYEVLDITKPYIVQGWVLEYITEDDTCNTLVIGENPGDKEDIRNLKIDFMKYIKK